MGFRVGDLVRFKRGPCTGEVATVVTIDGDAMVVRRKSGSLLWYIQDAFEPAMVARSRPAKSIDFPGGTTIEQAIDEAIKHAKWIETDIHFNFNGVDVIVPHKHADAKAIHEDWSCAMAVRAANRTLAREAELVSEREEWKAKAETYRIEAENMRASLAKFTDGGMSGDEVRRAQGDERARFMREVLRDSYQRLLRHSTFTLGELKASGLTLTQFCAREALAEANALADVAFPVEAKP